jgi:aminoglycoside phosphotransferase (APT) family kinase protein
VGDWLAANVPEESDHTLVHGDYKLDNVMFGPGTPPRMTGVLDWELATLGDPLADLGWMVLFWRDEGDSDPALPEGLVPTFMEHTDYPTRRDLVARYEDRTGREFTNQRFYRGLAAYKIVTTTEAMYFRYLAGDADDPLYPALEAGVPELAQRAQRIVDGEERL